MSAPLRKLWPELLATAALLAAVVVLGQRIVAATGGHLGYCLDDAYIHLAVAKNLATHHVWGVTPHEFSSSSSSPLWILLVAADYLIRGVNTTAPLVLNVLSAVAALFVGGAILRRRGMPQAGVLAALLAIVFFTPLPTVIFDGMEHVLHALLVFLWIAVLDRTFRESGPVPQRAFISLCVLAVLLTGCRFESLALIFITCGLLFLQQRRREAVAIGLCGLLPVAAYAAFATRHGWQALPASVLVKAPQSQWGTAFHVFEALGGRAFLMSLTAWHMSVVVGLSAVCLWRIGWRSFRTGTTAVVAIYLLTTIAHLQFGLVGWFYRYEAYLQASGYLVIALAIAELRHRADAWRLPLAPAIGLVYVAALVAHLWADHFDWLSSRAAYVELAVAIALIEAAVILRRRRSPRAVLPPAVAALAAVAIAVLLTFRSADAMAMTPGAAKNIYDQQWQMGRFLRENMGTDAVVLGDIGGPTFLSNVQLVDVAGLGTLESAQQILRGGLSEPFVEALARENDVQLAILYDRVFGYLVPPDWKLIGKWKAPDPRVTLGDTVVSFYAVNPARVNELALKLAAFSRELPPDVQVYLPMAKKAADSGDQPH